ncbi:MAG: alanine racemase [Phycisphaerae bacterium]|jgi:alanine racemase|nr:alanine racemase [Phycisphaerae bacterium]
MKIMEAHLTAEISVSAVRHNLQLLRGCVGADVRICPAVKADCYGHGLEILLPVIAEEADAMAVASAAEAIELRELGYAGEILMFFTVCSCANGEMVHRTLKELLSRGVTLTIVSPLDAEAAGRAAGELGIEAAVHIMIDTGMGRSGVPYNTASDLITRVRGERALRLAGLYTHFATADEADKSYALGQIENFRSVVDSCRGDEDLTIHAANSAAAIDLPVSHFDMIRPGIAVYGYQPSDQMHNRLPLRPCLKLTSLLMQIKDLTAGSSVGYALAHTFDRAARVGLVPVGYADGYSRRLSGEASMRIAGVDVPVCGRVSMDQVIVDLTDVPSARIGDEVEIISPDPSAPHSVESLARLAETIPYEITCGLGGRINRTAVK